MSAEKTYSAFISYRHLGPDMAAAKRVQTLLEGYRQPRGIAVGKRIGRIFRDTTELPTSRALDEAIQTALSESEFLIVILSEHFKESLWCLEELRTFKRMHGGRIDHILPVLISGEPSEVLPEELLYDKITERGDDGNEHIRKEAREPVCADIRGKNELARQRKLRTEFLRLAAPMLGCGYDDLYRRQRRRQQRNRALLMTLVLAVVLGYAGILLHNYRQIKQKNIELDEKNTALAEANGRLDAANRQLTEKNEALDSANQTLSEQKRELQQNESRLLTESARAARENRDYGRALSEAASALPRDEEDDRPYYAPAEALLWDLLDDSGPRALSREISAGEIIREYALSRDGRRCWMIGDSYILRCFDLTDGTLQWSAILPFKVTSSYDAEMILSEGNGCLYFTGPYDDPEQSPTTQAVLAVDCGSGEIKWTLDRLRARYGRLVLAEDESMLLYQIQTEELDAPDGAYCHNHCVFLDPGSGEFLEYYSPGQQLVAWDVDMVFSSSREGVFSEEDPGFFAGVYYEKTEDGYLRHFYVIDRNRYRWEDVYVDQRVEKGVIRYMRYQKDAHSLLVICDGTEELCAAEIFCIDTEKGVLNWSAHTPLVDPSVYGENASWILYPLCVTVDDSKGILLLGRRRNVYVYDLENGALLGEYLNYNDEKLLEADVEALYPAGDGVYCAVLRNGSSRLSRLRGGTLDDYCIGYGVGDTVTNCRIYNGGISSETLKKNRVEQEAGKGFQAFIPKDADTTLRVFYIYRWEASWPLSEVYPKRDGQYLCGLSSDYAFRAEDEALQIILYSHLGNLVHEYTVVTVNTESGELRESVFRTKKDLTKYGGAFLTSDQRGTLIDDGFGSLQLFDLESGELSQLYGNENYVNDRFSSDTNDHQGALFAEGVYKLAEKRLSDGAAVAAVCEDGLLRLWVDGVPQPDISLPEGLVWHRTVDSTSYRSFLMGANGYVLISAFPSGAVSYAMEGFWACSTIDDTWYFIEDETRGRADRPIAAAHEKPFFAVADADQKIRLYDILNGACRTELSIPVPGTSLRTIGFSQDDRYFFAVTSPSNCQLFIYRTEDGALVYSGDYHSARMHDPINAVNDPVNQRLFLLTGTGFDLYGYCFDTQTWTLLWDMEDLAAVDAETSKLLIRGTKGISIRDLPTTQELRAAALAMAEDMEAYWPGTTNA